MRINPCAHETAAAIDVTTGALEDSTCSGGYVQAAVKVDPATITVGYGYVQSERDATNPARDNNDTDAQQTFFVQCKVPVDDTFFVVPEFSFYDMIEDAMGNIEPEVWCLGLKWQMDF
jgi:hypothetical protein